MRPLQWWLRTKGFSPRGNPFRLIKFTLRCLCALVMWKKPWFLSQDPLLGASCRYKMLTTDASLTGWGAILEGCSSQGLWKNHHLSWHINCLEMMAVFLALKNFLADLRGQHVLVRSDNTSVVSYINHQGVCGHIHFANWHASCEHNPPVVPREVVVSSSSLHPGGPEYRSRHPVETGAEARGMEALPRGGRDDMEGVRPGTSGSVCVNERRLIVHSGSPSRIQLLPDWTQWCRRGQGFV